jgi:hypothetical protein
MKVALNPPPSALLESLRSIGYTIETAIADIVDNSITAGASRIAVRYLWNGGKPWIAICDNGDGMGADELLEAMRLGSRSPNEVRNSRDLGRFGLGMKTASISQCRQLVVVSKKDQKISACKWDLDETAASQSSEWEVTVLEPEEIRADKILSDLISQRLDSLRAGTIVLWRKLDADLGDPSSPAGEARFSSHMDASRKHLEVVFHRFLAPSLNQQKLSMDFNDSELVPFDPFGTPVPARQELTAERIAINDDTILVQPYVLPHASKAGSVTEYQKLAGEEGYLQNQGFYVYRNQRLIIKATWFRLIPKDELNKLIRIRVDIPNSLDHLWRIDIKKSQASPPEPVRRELKRIIQKISGSGRIVFTNRATRIRNRQVTPVWRREVVDGRVRYLVNEEHPIVMGLIKELPNTKVEALRACFALINSTFPYDMYYADAADDRTEFDNAGPDEETVKQVGIQLVRALRSCGFSGDKLREQLKASEFFTCSPELFEALLKAEGALND